MESEKNSVEENLQISKLATQDANIRIETFEKKLSNYCRIIVSILSALTEDVSELRNLSIEELLEKGLNLAIMKKRNVKNDLSDDEDEDFIKKKLKNCEQYLEFIENILEDFSQNKQIFIQNFHENFSSEQK